MGRMDRGGWEELQQEKGKKRRELVGKWYVRVARTENGTCSRNAAA